jgi:molecular chaperone GrpE
MSRKLAPVSLNDYNISTMNDDDKQIEEQAVELENEQNIDETNGRVEEETDDVVFDDEAELSTAEVIKKLRSKLKTAVEEKQAYLNNWQKDKAEFINARKRDDESKQEFLKFSKMAVIEDILPVLDSFDMAMANTASWEQVSKEWRNGVEGIFGQLQGILAKHDVKPFGAKGEAFDPNLHHSIGMIKAENGEADHTIAEVLQKGYMMSGKVIRPALVKVFEA